MAVVSNADALMLGDIQVNSRLGQPLSARIAFIDISGVDPLQLKLKLAGVEEYKKLDLQYPAGNKFSFQIVNMPGALVPFIRISTQTPVDDPFVDLLLEVSAASGKFVKSYTVLLDPPTDLPAPVVSPSAAAQTVPPAAGSASRQASSAVAATTENPQKNVVKLRRHHRHSTHRTRSTAAHSEETALHGQSHMKLAMSLSISKYSPATPANPKDAADALQEELIAKQKTLEDLQLQISEMQGVLMRLHNPGAPDGQPASAVEAGNVGEDKSVAIAASSAAPTEAAEKPVEVALPSAAKEKLQLPIAQPEPEAASASDWLNPILGGVILLLGGAAWFGYRKYRLMQTSAHGPFDDVGDELTEAEDMLSFHQSKLVAPGPIPLTETYIQKPVAAMPPVLPIVKVPQTVAQAVPEPAPEPETEKPSLTFGEQSAEMPAYTEQASTPIVPPEYAILMEANKHLRAGNEQLAEEALIRAIEVNPKNSYGYHALLKIYAAHNDKLSFEKIAMQLMQISGAAAFEEVAEMGRKLDPHNPLYD